METVKFSTVDEFLAELEKEKDNVDRGIVRVTGVTTPGKLSPIYNLTLIATAIVIAAGTGKASVGKQLVKLEKHVGQLFIVDNNPADPQSEATYKRGKELAEQLEHDLKEMGFDVRPGVIELESEEP